jgi:hypothetical protein
MAFDSAAPISEHALPVSMRTALETSRASRPDEHLTCLAFYTCENGREVARLGLPSAIDAAGVPPPASALSAKDLVVLSVAITEMSFRDVRTIKHVLIAHTAATRISAACGTQPLRQD